MDHMLMDVRAVLSGVVLGSRSLDLGRNTIGHRLGNLALFDYSRVACTEAMGQLYRRKG